MTLVLLTLIYNKVEVILLRRFMHIYYLSLECGYYQETDICNNINNITNTCSSGNCPLCDVARPVDEFKYEASDEIAQTMANYFGNDEKFAANEYIVTKEIYEENSTIVDYLQSELKPLITNSESLEIIDNEIARLKREVK
jgi:hypothetical protein